MSGYTVSLSIVTYNNEAHIGRLLDAIHRYVHGVPYHVYVIDNGSTDRTVEIVRSKDEYTTLLQSGKNIGFGKAHNRVLDLIDSKYHIIVNPDIFFEQDIVTAMADYLDNNSDIGLLTPKVLYPDGRVQILPKRNPKLKYLAARRMPFGFLKKYRKEYEMHEKNMDSAFDIEFATGCFMFLRTDLLIKAGGFDKRYFMYFEDADLTRSIRAYARAEYNPEFTVFHYWDRAGMKKPKYFLIQVRSMIKYMRKWKREKSEK